MDFKIIYPSYYQLNEESWDSYEVWCKGYLAGVKISVDDKSYTVCFYDDGRLSQDLEDELASRDFVKCCNTIILKEVNTKSIEKAVSRLVETKSFSDFKPDD